MPDYLGERDGMSRFHLAEGETLDIEVSDSEAFRSRLPEIYNALVKSSSFGISVIVKPVSLLRCH